MQSPGFINGLFDVHGDRHALGNAAGKCAALSSLGDARRLVQPEMISVRMMVMAFSAIARSMLFPFTGTVTLHRPGQSSRTGAILWLLSGHLDHEILAQPPKGPK